MKPVVVCQSSVAGGAERYLCQLYAGLAGPDWTPSLIGEVAGWGDIGLASVAANLGPKWGGRTMLSGLARLPAERRAVDRLARASGADIFHVQFKREQVGLTGVLARHAPVLWTEHGRFTSGLKGSALAKGYRSASRHAAAIVCVSDEVAQDVRSIVGDRTEVLTISNAVDVVALAPPTAAQRTAARAALGLDTHTPVLAWVGRISATKLPLLAVEAGARFDGVTLMAGTGPMAAEVAARADGERVRYLGFRDDPSTIYRAADAFLFTSNNENEGYPTNAILEAAAHGLPIITNPSSGFGGYPMITSGAGALATSDSGADLAAAATALLTRRDAASALARQWARSHSREAWIERHRQVITAAGATAPETARGPHGG